MSSSHVRTRDVAMKDSWSRGEDRRDSGRVDRGAASQRRTPSPTGRRPDSEREGKARDRGADVSRSAGRQEERRRDRTPDRRRQTSRSPVRDSREEVRQRNRGRELLDTRGSAKSKHGNHHSPPSKRHKSRSPSRERSHRKKPRRSRSRSPPRTESKSARSERVRRVESPARRRSPDRKAASKNISDRDKVERRAPESERRKQSPERRARHTSREHRESSRRGHEPRRRSRSPQPERQQLSRPRSPHTSEGGRSRHHRRSDSRSSRRRSLDADRYDHPSRPRAVSPGHQRASRPVSPPRNQRTRTEHLPISSHDKAKGTTSTGANSIEVPRRRRGSDASRHRANSVERPKSRQRSPAVSSDRHQERPEKTSGAKGAERDEDKMSGRGYSPHGGYPNQQMQAAFPQRQQYNQGPPQQNMDARFSQSPQHITTHHSYHNSPQAHSPYSDGRGGWGQGQSQFSPPPQPYPQNYGPQSNYPPSGHQGYYPQQSPSLQYQGPVQHQQQSFRGGHRGSFRGTHSNQRGNFRGRGTPFQNDMGWNNQNGPGRPPQHPHSGNVTPQQGSPPAFVPSGHGSPDPTMQQQQQAPAQVQALTEPDEDDSDLFRPSKDLQVEDTKKPDEETMPPPSRPTPTGPQSNKFSFAFKASSKAPAAAPKPEISQKLSATPFNKAPPSNPSRDVRSPPKGPQGHRSAIPTEPASARNRPDSRREPPPPRKIKKIMRRVKERPTLPTEFAASDSVYYRKPGNESVVGSGTYGKVFKAIHVYTKKLVALKKIRMEGERDGFPVTAVREIKLLQSLKHPNVVNLQEVMVEKNDCFMVFEYLSHDLTGLLNHPSFKLEPAHKKHLAKQLFEGLDYLHRRGVLHRDIKAANILVSNEGQLKLADFGLARFYAKRKQLDYTNRVITIWYRSPELLLGETQYGAAVDVWSAACVLVEIFTRHAIFPGDGGEISQLEKIYNVLGTPNVRDWPGLVDMAWFELLRPSAKRPNLFAEKYKERVTPAAFELLSDMFQYDPAKRPSASDVLEHPYFTVEEPPSRQAIELQALEGDWHEFESKALRKENEKKEKEARRAQQKETDAAKKEKKRGPEEENAEREAKRLQTSAPGVTEAMSVTAS